MTTDTNGAVDYVAVLADLKARRAALDAAISGIELVLGQSPSAGVASFVKIRNGQSQTPRLLPANERVIFMDYETDSAIILFFKGDLKLPEVPIALLPVGEVLSVGLDAGWIGYPVIQQFTLCFFSGTVSARLDARKAYLIDGVAINGVSGGPVIHCPASDRVQIVGCISEYHANRATGETLPGLLIAQDVSHFHGVAEEVKTIEEANIKKREFEEAQKAKEAAASQAAEAAGAAAGGSQFGEPPSENSK